MLCCMETLLYAGERAVSDKNQKSLSAYNTIQIVTGVKVVIEFFFQNLVKYFTN